MAVRFFHTPAVYLAGYGVKRGLLWKCTAVYNCSMKTSTLGLAIVLILLLIGGIAYPYIAPYISGALPLLESPSLPSAK